MIDSFEVHTPRTTANSFLVTKTIIKDDPRECRELMINKEGKGEFMTIEEDAIKRAWLTFAGAAPFIENGLTALCAKYPEMVDDSDKDGFYYRARIPYEMLIDLCTGGIPEVRERFTGELKNLIDEKMGRHIMIENKDKTKWLAVVPFFIPAFGFKDAEYRAKNLGLDKELAFVEIYFFKPLFTVKGKDNRPEFIRMDNASYSKLWQIKKEKDKDPEFIQKRTYRDYKTNTNKTIPNKEVLAFYKFYLYLLLHSPVNPDAKRIIIDNVVDMLKFVDPGQLIGGRYLRNYYEAKVFIDTAVDYLAEMDKRGYCKCTDIACNAGGALVREGKNENGNKVYEASIEIHRPSRYLELKKRTPKSTGNE